MRATYRRRFPGGRKSVIYAVLVHVVLIALVVIGVRWQAKPVSPAAVIQAQAVNDAEMQKEIQRRKRDEAQRAAAEAKRLRDQQERERQTAEAQRQKEQAALAEQQRKADAKRKAAEAEQKRKDAQRQAEAQRKKDAEVKRAAEAQRKKDAEVRRQAAEKGLQEQLASEEKERADAQAKAQQQARAQSELARYQALIKQRIENSWVIPGGWTKNMECLVHVRLIPTGEVIEATVVRSSGNAAFDRSAENAVYKASPLPLPDDKALFEHFRDFNFDFTPQERS
jgi:colicin import membrane protein